MPATFITQNIKKLSVSVLSCIFQKVQKGNENNNFLQIKALQMVYDNLPFAKGIIDNFTEQ